MHGFIPFKIQQTEDYGSFLDSLKSIRGISLVEPTYFNADGDRLSVGESFCASFRKTAWVAHLFEVGFLLSS
jgi:hypothetical protein